MAKKKFSETKLGSLIGGSGLGPITELIGGSNGILSVLKENSDPSSKISSKKSAASVLLFTAVAMASKENAMDSWPLIVGFCACGTALLLGSLFSKS